MLQVAALSRGCRDQEEPRDVTDRVRGQRRTPAWPARTDNVDSGWTGRTMEPQGSPGCQVTGMHGFRVAELLRARACGRVRGALSSTAGTATSNPARWLTLSAPGRCSFTRSTPEAYWRCERHACLGLARLTPSSRLGKHRRLAPGHTPGHVRVLDSAGGLPSPAMRSAAAARAGSSARTPTSPPTARSRAPQSPSSPAASSRRLSPGTAIRSWTAREPVSPSSRRRSDRAQAPTTARRTRVRPLAC